MKTLTHILLITSLIVTLSSIEINAKELMPLPEETYIEDIPFNTEAIFECFVVSELKKDCCMLEEGYIDDIPFDTEKIAKQAAKMLLPAFNLEDEQVIPDLPEGIL
jgi:hypothetical protein